MRIIFCLGSNVGNRAAYLQKAIKLLQTRLELQNLKESTTLENKALLLPNSPLDWDIDFFNKAISADINLNKFPPLEILKITQKIEIDLGKTYRGKWGPREIDIDIIAIEDLQINEVGILQIPHPEIFNRDFVINTVNQIEPKQIEIMING